jgi:preprotein translocase subunit YajC
MEPNFFFHLLGQTSPGGDMVSMLIMMGCLFAGMYFLIIAPQQKKQKEQQKMVDSLANGDRIITIGGFHGIVQSVKDSKVVVKIAEGVKVELEKSAVQTCLDKDAKASK